MKVRFFLLFSLHFVTSSRDFYVGMFKNNDLLVAVDTLYKERTPFRLTRAMYGRLFKCEITYFRVVDRLGTGRMPRVEITRGGLRKKYLVIRITSAYDMPISVNIYVGCENKYNITRSTKIIRPTRPTVTTKKGADRTDTNATTTAANATTKAANATTIADTTTTANGTTTADGTITADGTTTADPNDKTEENTSLSPSTSPNANPTTEKAKPTSTDKAADETTKKS